jgi:hypothetical protein
MGLPAILKVRVLDKDVTCNLPNHNPKLRVVMVVQGLHGYREFIQNVCKIKQEIQRKQYENIPYRVGLESSEGC